MSVFPDQTGFPSNAESIGTGVTGTVPGMKEAISDKAEDVKMKITEFGRKAADKFNDSRESAAGALDKTASSLQSSGDQLSGAARSTAEKLQATANYVRHTDLKGMAEDVGDIVKRYPGSSLAVAAIVGFLVARGLRTSD